MGNKKEQESGLPAPEDLAREILVRAIDLTKRLEDWTEKRAFPQAQDALVSFGQLLLLGSLEAFRKMYPDRDLTDYENQVFLQLSRLTLNEFLQREAEENEWEYFVTYYRSHFELLKRELGETNGEPLAEDDALSEEIRRSLEELFSRFFA